MDVAHRERDVVEAALRDRRLQEEEVVMAASAQRRKVRPG
jgi:hypothetical protein